ncbi:hypothetical protein NC651_031205 [Populus alba x Populus x berolinensis]|nr:hypothetical protein NC651_031205 [Populus alba x Populus x berolinensis]
MALREEDSLISELNLACSDLKTVLRASSKIEDTLEKMDKKFDVIDESLSTSSRRVAPLHSLAMAAKALETRINRAVSPALALLDSFKLCESLQQKLLEVSSQSSADKNPENRLKLLLKLVDCVDKLNAVINTISEDGEPVIQKLQEVVEFLSRTKATDQYRAYRLRETLVTLKILYETEIDAMKFDGLLNEALLNLQDEHESILQKLRHHNIDESQGGKKPDMADSVLGTELEIEVLRRISETLAANDCLDTCIDIYVKVRYVRAVKALMRLNPDYLKTYTPEEIDEMEWGTLETAISLWIQHFELALRTVFVSEKKLSNQILGGILDGAVWLECFVKIADKIMAVFFRFGEGVARSNKEPQKLLDMFDSLEKLKTEFSEIFEGEAGADICTRFRDLEKLLVHSSSKVFWEFGLQIKGNSDGFPPTQDGSVPKLKKLRYKDRILPQVFAMNTYWYIYTRTRNTELGKLLGEQYLKMNYKVVAEESAYMYQRQAWKPLVRLFDKEELKRENKSENEDTRALIREKMEGFLKGVSEVSQRHRSGSYTIHDVDLREQIKEATVKLVVPAYIEFLNAYSSALPSKSYVKPEAVHGLLDQIFKGSDGKLKRRDSKHRTRGGT